MYFVPVFVNLIDSIPQGLSYMLSSPRESYSSENDIYPFLPMHDFHLSHRVSII